MKLGWKLILIGFGGAFAFLAFWDATDPTASPPIGPVLIGAVLFWVGVICLWFNIGGKAKKGRGSGKL